MKLNLSNTMFMLVMTTSIMMMFSSNNLMMSWMSMEMNTMSFMPLLTKSKNLNKQAMSYFIIQSSTSLTMLMMIMISQMNTEKMNLQMIMSLSMMMKIGIMPFHSWMPSLMKSMSWMNCMMLMTLQKISPIMLNSQINTSKLMILPIITSMVMSPLTAMKQLSIKIIMAYSSITNSSMLMISSMMSKSVMMMFLTIYIIIMYMITKKFKTENVNFKNQMTEKTNKESTITMMMLSFSVSGMPPTLGFFPKLLITKLLMKTSMLLSWSTIVSSILSTMMYLNLFYPMLMWNTTKKKKNKKNFKKENQIMNSINMLGTPTIYAIKSM